MSLKKFPLFLFFLMKSLRRININNLCVFFSFEQNILFFLIFIFTIFYFTILYWFCHTLTWIRHGCTWVPNPGPLSHLLPLWVIPVHQPTRGNFVVTFLALSGDVLVTILGQRRYNRHQLGRDQECCETFINEQDRSWNKEWFCS